MTFLECEVTTGPTFADSLGYPSSIPAARSFAATPGLERSVFGEQLTERLGRGEANLSGGRLVKWIKDFFGVYDESVVGEEAILVEILRLELHVPRIAGAAGRLPVEHDETTSDRFSVTVLGSGGGASQPVAFEAKDVVVTDRCTAVSYNAAAVWRLIKITGGPDAGRRFGRLAEIGGSIAR